MIIEGKLTLKAVCGHEITTEFGTIEVAGISRIAARILRDECPACKFVGRRYRLTRVSIDRDNTAALEAYLLCHFSYIGRLGEKIKMLKISKLQNNRQQELILYR